MQPEDEVRVCHLVGAANKAMTYAASRSRDDLDRDELLRLALTKLVEIVVKPRSTSAAICASLIRRCRGRQLHGCGAVSSITTSTDSDWWRRGMTSSVRGGVAKP